MRIIERKETWTDFLSFLSMSRSKLNWILIRKICNCFIVTIFVIDLRVTNGKSRIIDSVRH